MATTNSVSIKVYGFGNTTSGFPRIMNFDARSHVEELAAAQTAAAGIACPTAIYYGGQPYYVVETATAVAALANA